MIDTLIQHDTTLAGGALAMCVIVVIWKTVGLAIVPGYEEMFGDAPHAYYPRRIVQEQSNDLAWHWLYLIMYGVFGTAAQLAGLLISVTKKSSDYSRAKVKTTAKPNVLRAQLLGSFHVVIGIHHVVWAWTASGWGRLQLDHFTGVPLYLLGGIAAAGCLWHGLLLLCTTTSTPFKEVLRHKVLVDATALLTLVELIGFLVATWLNLERNVTLERFLWILTFLSPTLLFLFDFIESITARAAQSQKKRK